MVLKAKQNASKTFQNEALTRDEAVNLLVSCADELEELYTFSKSTKESNKNTLTWKDDISENEFRNKDRIMESCSGKMPVELFEIFFNAEIRAHLIDETINYAHTEHNDLNFSINDDDFKNYIAILLY